MESLIDLEPGLLGRLEEFMSPVLLSITGSAERRLAATYSKGLLGSATRKNVEQIARGARGVECAPAFERDMRAMLSNDQWRHQSLMWSGAHRVLERTAGWTGITLDDTAILKQGSHSVGVANQYAGCVGGLKNSQVLVSIGIAQEHASAPLAMQLFLPESWDKDKTRRTECHVPDEIRYRPKWRIAIELLTAYDSWSLPKLPVLADAAYGEVREFRHWLNEHNWPYVLGIGSKTSVWPAGVTFEQRPSPRGAGRPTTRLQPTVACSPRGIYQFAATLPATCWQTVCWRDGSRGPQRARFAAIRVRPSRGWDHNGIPADALQQECWLLLHWPHDEPKPTKAWLSNLPAETEIEALVALGRLRWRVERDYREGKGLVGLDHYEGRTWHGIHHHAALVTLSQQFLACERLDAIRRNESREDAEPLSAAFPP